MISPSVILLVRRLLSLGVAHHEICREAEVSRMTVNRIARGKLTAHENRCPTCRGLITTDQCQLCLARRRQRMQK